jgi:sulfur-oxidizing protein SoxY
MDHARRNLLKGTGAAGTLAVAAAAGLLHPSQLLAADWNKTAFAASSASDAIKAIGATSPTESSEIAIKAPEIAENGAVVPVEVNSKIPNTESIAIVVEKNPSPLAASFDLSAGAEGFVSTRIKMGETSKVIAVVKADGKYYTAAKEVKVTIGGCGG